VSRTALIVIDMITAYDFPDAEKVVPAAKRAVPAMRQLIDEARERDMPVIYVNDNYGHWRSNSHELVGQALEGEHPELIEPIRPGEEDVFLIKVRHSIFYGTSLEYLLNQDEISNVILVGQVTEQCILYSALDAYIRHLEVRVPRDAVVHFYESLADAALTMMERNMKADLTPVRG